MKRKLTVFALLTLAWLTLEACEQSEPTANTATVSTSQTEEEEEEENRDLLEVVLDRGELNCGVNEILPGFGYKDADGTFTGFDVDLCRAVAAALFGNADAVKYYPLTAAARFEAVASGVVDLLSRNTTWTQSRDSDLGLDFGPTTYYDGQQLMGRKPDGFTSHSSLDAMEGATICTNAGTTTEKNMTETAAALGIPITLKTFEDFNIVMENFKSGACDLITSDGSGLVSRKVSEGTRGEAWVIFPSVPISKEPLGPAWLQNQSRFGDVVTWTIFAMLIAEEKGITSQNVDDDWSSDREASRLLGASQDELQTKMGLEPDGFYDVIKQVGNYAEVFDRHLKPLGLGRGLNTLFSDGGLLYPPPAR
jgi:general L-amino acid transport system substrate-binding protein